MSDCSFRIAEGSCLAIVGESGSGKSLTCRSIVRLNDPRLRQTGDIVFRGENLSALPDKAIRRYRGRRVCMIVQNGMRAFDPSRTVGAQLKETIASHFDWSADVIRDKTLSAMDSVMLRDPAAVMTRYPHQLSGGMLQRLMIAIALVLEPDLIIADEPTTALDTVSQFEVVNQLVRLRERSGCSMLVVSHDMGVVRKVADDIVVMRDGAVVESGETERLFAEPRHVYTRDLATAKQALHRRYRNLMGGEDDAER